MFKKQFPADFENSMDGWSFSKIEIENNVGKLLVLDIDFGNFCSLNCPHCFRRNNQVDFNRKKLMSYENILNVIKDGKKLGLKFVKFLGAGEPFQNKMFLEFLRELIRLEITPLIFTKGHVLGDDNEVKKWYSDYGISTGEELVEELKKVDASILLGFNSFDKKIQDKMVGNVKDYTQKRNRTLNLLVQAGFNKHNPTKIGLIPTPITKESYSEVLEIYKWSRVRNLYVVACPPMVSGRCSNEFWKGITPNAEELINLYVQIYKFNLQRGIQTMEQIEEEGIASYAGTRPCNQVACGMYVTSSGVVLRCPGDDVTIFGNVFKQSLEEIWINSENFKRSGTFNCCCPPKVGKSIPTNLFVEVLRRIKQ